MCFLDTESRSEGKTAKSSEVCVASLTSHPSTGQMKERAGSTRDEEKQNQDEMLKSGVFW